MKNDISTKIAELQQVVENIKVEWDYVSYDTRSIVMEACSRVLSDMEYQLIYYNTKNRKCKVYREDFMTELLSRIFIKNHKKLPL